MSRLSLIFGFLVGTQPVWGNKAEDWLSVTHPINKQ